jgi:molecular chaperone DnaK (HSP70)
MVFKKITDKQKTATNKVNETDEKMAEDLVTQFIKILKERNELKAQIDAKNTDLLNISQDLVAMTM